MKRWTKHFTNGWAQNIRKVENLEASLIEVIKYDSKIFTEPDPNFKEKKDATRNVYASALYNIQVSMKGIRLFDRFRFNLPKVGTNCSQPPSTICEYENFIYYNDFMNWINKETGNALSGEVPDEKLLELLKNRINKDLQ